MGVLRGEGTGDEENAEGGSAQAGQRARLQRGRGAVGLVRAPELAGLAVLGRIPQPGVLVPRFGQPRHEHEEREQPEA